MVLMALRGANARTAAPAVAVPYSGAPEPVQTHAPAFDEGPVGASTLSEAMGDSAAFEYESRPPIPFEELESGEFELYQPVDPVERAQGVQADSCARSENNAPQERAPVFEGFVPSTNTIDPGYAAVGESQPILRSASGESSVKSDFEANIVEEDIERPPSIQEAPADPWENPLSAWDYSRTEWPALDGATRKRSFNKTIAVIAAVVLIASAAGYYFLVFRASDPPLAAATDNSAKAQVSAGAPVADPTGQALSGSPAAAAMARSDSAAAETKNHDPSDRETVEVNGRFSLQAAAFATQDGADEFAEKLKQAGLASYVVPADIARRGRWYRVRVGRFDSEQSAQQFAAEAQRRARAAGIGVQLIVCQYGQP
jgi:cell division septation protein DedD